MRVVLQRVIQARVEVSGETVGQIGRGLLLLVGIGKDDEEQDVAWMAEKIPKLRIFDDKEGKMNLSVQEVAGEILSVSQFTLYGDARKGRRPSYSEAAQPERALHLYQQFNRLLQSQGLKVETGRFAAHMQVHLVNDGRWPPILDSRGR